MAKIDAFFKLMFDQGASDLHLVSGQQPILRLHGDMERVKYKMLEDGELKAMLYEIAPELKIKQYEETGDRSEEHTSELQSPCNLVCRLLLEKKKNKNHLHSSLASAHRWCLIQRG